MKVPLSEITAVVREEGGKSARRGLERALDWGLEQAALRRAEAEERRRRAPREAASACIRHRRIARPAGPGTRST